VLYSDVLEIAYAEGEPALAFILAHAQVLERLRVPVERLQAVVELSVDHPLNAA
jgi:hypothetical protein